jgi:hypothetical protein
MNSTLTNIVQQLNAIYPPVEYTRQIPTPQELIQRHWHYMQGPGPLQPKETKNV